jgi:MAF protein
LNIQPLILASRSPRRRAFMELLGLPFEVHAADIDERNGRGERPADLVARLSRGKALAVAACTRERTVIGADTIVTLDDELLAKPADPVEAAAMLRRLRDRAHQVYSGVTVCPPDGRAPLTGVVESTVWMRDYAADEIATYVASGSPLDKAGAYGIQDARFHPVARLQGCYASVMGLPLCELARLLGLAGAPGLALPPGDVALADVPALCSAVTGVPCCGGARLEFVFEE